MLSGDIHYSEILKTPIPEENMKYNLYEVTSSGLSHNTDEILYGIFFQQNYYDTFVFEKYKVFNFIDLSFATIEVNWENLSVNLQLRNINGTIIKSNLINYNELIPNKNIKGTKLENSHRYWILYQNLKEKFQSDNYKYHIKNFIGFIIVETSAFLIVIVLPLYLIFKICLFGIKKCIKRRNIEKKIKKN